MSQEQQANSPIARLPPELLAAVFVWAAKLDPIPLPTAGFSPSLAWVRLTHVCSIWRQIALRKHSLWAGAIGGLRGATTEFLARAGEHALLSFFYFNSLAETDSLPLLDRHTIVKEFRAPGRAGRVEGIDWVSNVTQWDIPAEVDALNGILAGRTFGVLKRLLVEISWSLEERNIDDAGPLYASSLQTVRLIGYFIPIVAPQLTDLTLKSLNGWVSAGEVLQVLRSCPLLTSVEVEDFNSGDLPLEGDATIQLANLKRLALELPLSGREITAFIKHLSIPATVNLHVHKSGFFATADYVLLATVFEAAGVVDEPAALEVNDAILQLKAVSSPRVKLSFSCSDLNLPNALSMLDLARYLCRVVHLTTTSSFLYSSVANWTRVFHQFPAVSSLELDWPKNRRRPSMQTIFAALGSGPKCPLPELAKMVVCSDVPPTQLKANDVLGCLNARKAAGAHPLTSLGLLCWKKDDHPPRVLNERSIRALERLVQGGVRWKGS